MLFVLSGWSGCKATICVLLSFIKLSNVIIISGQEQKDETIYLDGIKVIRCKPFLKISRGFYSIDLIIKFSSLKKRVNPPKNKIKRPVTIGIHGIFLSMYHAIGIAIIDEIIKYNQ